jgi:uncharacterized protein (DUF305 family)
VKAMRRRPTSIAISIMALLLGHLLSVLVETRNAGAQHSTHRHNGSAGEQSGDFARALAAAMDQMHSEMTTPRPTGNADVDFLATMIPHHAGAVEMARLVLVHGTDPLVRRLAEEIIAGQQAEMAAMQARLTILRQGADPTPDGYPSLGGTRGSLN